MSTEHEQLRELVNTALRRGDYSFVFSLLDQRPGSVVIDVGTNIGGYLKAWLNHGASAVHAFEPVPAVFEVLKREFGYDPRVILNQLALSDVEKTHRGCQILNAHTLAPAASTPLSIALEDSGAFDFEATTLDQYAANKHLAAVDFIKIDVDGFEPKVLRGMPLVVSTFRPVIMIELSGLPKALGENCEEMVDQIYRWNYLLCTTTGEVCENPLFVMEAYPWRTSLDMVAIPREQIGTDWPRVR